MTTYMTELHHNNIVAAQAICQYIQQIFEKTSPPMQQVVALDVFRMLLQASPDQLMQYVQNNNDLQQVFALSKWPSTRDMVRHGLKMRRQLPKLINEVRNYLTDSKPELKWLGIIE